MCGIAGLINFKANIVENINILKKMVKTLERRGPDTEGLFYLDIED